MSFGTGALDDPQKIGAGERYGANQLILTALVFQTGLVIGRFAKILAGSLDNLNGVATPLIAGVVLRNVANPVEDLGSIDSALYGQAEYVRQGLVTVRAKAGETPSKFDRIYASNAGDANDGMATVTGTDVATDAQFIEVVDTDLWLIHLNPIPA